MKNSIELPKDYEPFKKMVLCSNSLTNCKVAISVDKHPIYLIGKSEKPLIWLQAQKDRKGNWVYLIEKSVVHDNNIRLITKENALSVYLSEQLLLHAYRISEDEIEVTHIDFRPIGFSIYGNIEMLKVGNQELSNSGFDNVHTMIAVQ